MHVGVFLFHRACRRFCRRRIDAEMSNLSGYSMPRSRLLSKRAYSTIAAALLAYAILILVRSGDPLSLFNLHRCAAAASAAKKGKAGRHLRTI